MRETDLGSLIRPVITIRQLDAAGHEVGRQVVTNALTYAAMDIFMNAWLRSQPAQVTHLYVRFGDSGAAPGYLAPSGGDIRTTNRGNFIASSDSIRGGLWVPVLSAPIQDSTDPASYIGNRATFFFRIPANISQDQVSPSGNFNSATSWIYAMGLGVAFNTGDRQFDKIVSVMQAYGYDVNPSLGNFTKFQVPPGGQTAIDYAVPFTFNPTT